MHSEVAVVGGGIGGLAAALSLFRAGFDVHVYEQAHTLREVGAGIQVSPNASGCCMGWALPTNWRSLACDRVHIIKGDGITVGRY